MQTAQNAFYYVVNCLNFRANLGKFLFSKFHILASSSPKIADFLNKFRMTRYFEVSKISRTTDSITSPFSPKVTPRSLKSDEILSTASFA